MEYTRTIEQTFPLDPGGVVHAVNRRGEMVVRGEERDDVLVTAQVRINALTRGEADDRFEVFELPMTAGERGLDIGPPAYSEPHPHVLFGISLSRFMKGPRLDLLIRVPRAVDVEVESGSGSIQVEGIRGRCSVAGQRTKIEVSEVEGDVKIDGRTGRVEATSIRGALEIAVRSGKVTVSEATGPVRIRTSTGKVEARRVLGNCTIETRTGALAVEDVEGEMHLSTRTGGVRYRGRITKDVTVSVRTGVVQLAVTPDSSFFIDAEARTGTVSADLPVNYLEEPPPDAATVRVRVRTGGIQIRPAPGS